LQTIGDSTAFESARVGMTHWGSFPSDQAALLAIATILAFTVGRRSGLFFLVLSVYVCLFRIAFGYHWPSDIAGGALLGTAVIGVALRLHGRLRRLTDGVLGFAQNKPSTAAAIGFVLLALALRARLFR
jgi:membrane-associated phospholipid phosphatase